MTITILESFGRGGLSIYEPPTSIQELPWTTITDAFKQDFLGAWTNAYEWEQVSGNAGINQLDILQDMVKTIESGKLDTSLSFEEAYDQEVKRTLSSLDE